MDREMSKVYETIGMLVVFFIWMFIVCLAWVR
jgi:hypothetical protein